MAITITRRILTVALVILTITVSTAITITHTAIGAQDIVTGMILIEVMGASMGAEAARVLMEAGRVATGGGRVHIGNHGSVYVTSSAAS